MSENLFKGFEQLVELVKALEEKAENGRDSMWKQRRRRRPIQ